nr:putative reverse transcriptase domain-containing protein [Tanacetum cinerariifolium]
MRQTVPLNLLLKVKARIEMMMTAETLREMETEMAREMETETMEEIETKMKEAMGREIPIGMIEDTIRIANNLMDQKLKGYAVRNAKNKRSPQVVSAAKLPILNPNEFDLWKMRIKQYFLMTDYSLWERLARNNKLKARGTLLMALPDKHQLKFNIHKDAKALMEAIEKRFGGNKETKKRNKPDLEEQSLDDLFNSLKIYEAKVKSSSSTSTSTQNIAFVSSSNTDSTNEPVSAAASVSAVSAKILVSALPNVDTLRFDMSKVECYNCHMKGHFARECRTPKDTRRNGAAEPQRRNVPIETSTLNALVSQCDGVGSYDWNFQAEEEPTNYALMAFTSSSSSSSDNELRDNALVVLRQNLKKAEQERDDLKLKLENLPPSRIYDRYQSGDGYHAVPPPHTGTFMPPKPNLVFYNAPNVNEAVYTAFNVELSPTKPDNDLSHTHRPLAPIIEDWVSDSKDDYETKIPKNVSIVNKSKLVPITAARPVTAAVSKPLMTRPRQAKTIVTTPQSPPKRHINRSPSPKAGTFPPKVIAAKGNPQHALKNKRVIDSECLRHMTGNMSYLFDFEEINGGYVAFGGNPKGGKFDGKVDEEFLVGYFVSSKAFRVLNSRTQIVQETLHINFLENKPNVASSGPAWLFDVDTLTKTMNNQPVTAYNQSNPSAGVQEQFDAKKNTDGNAAFEGKKPKFEGRKPHSKVHVSPKFEEFFNNSINENNAAGTLAPAVGQLSTNSTNTFSVVGPSNVAVNLTHGKSSYVDSSQLPDDPNMPEFEDITYSDDEENVGAEADFINLETSITVSPIPTTRVHKDHHEEGIDYEEVFTPVARIEAIRLFLAYASFMGFMVYQIDVKSANLYGTIKKEVYVCQPPGFEDPNYPNKVYKVVKALYGLHQAPRACQDKYVTEILRKFGLTDGKSASTPIDTEKPLLKDPDGGDYPKDSPFNLVAYSDSDYAGASLDRKSTTRGCELVGCRLISWQCKKQTVVATSSTQAEYVAAANASEGFNQIIDFLNASLIKYALIVNPNIYVSCIKQFWTFVSVKKGNDVTRLQALVDKKNVIITEATIRDALRLDDAEGIDCLPNEEIFAKLSRMGYEKPSTKLTFYKAFFSPQWKFLIHTILQCMSAKRTSLNEFSLSMASAVICLSTVNVDDVPADGVADEGAVSVNVDNIPDAIDEPSIPSPTPPTQTPPPSQDIPSTSQVQPMPPPSLIGQPPSPQQQPQPSQDAQISMDLLHNLLDTCTTLTRRVKNLEQDKIAQALEITKVDISDDTVMDDVSKQGRIIADMDADVDVTLKDVANIEKEVTTDAKIKKSTDVQGRQAESQAQIYQIDLEHADKVLSMQDDKVEPAELQKVMAVVITSKLITEVGVVIRDPEETATPSTIIHTEPKSKDRGKGIMVHKPKPLKKKTQIEQDEAYARELEAELNKNTDWDEMIDQVKRKEKEDNVVIRYQALKRKPQTEAQAKKNIMIYLRNMEEEDNKALKRLSESQEDKADKKKKLDEEVEELRKHLQIVSNNDDDVYTEATPLALKESKKCSWSSKRQKLETVRVLWCADYNIHYNTVDLAGREEISTYKELKGLHCVQQPTYKGHNVGGQSVARAYKTGNNEKRGYARPLPFSNKCKLHHEGKCIVRCSNCKKVWHMARDYKATVVTTTRGALEPNQKVVTCYECRRKGERKKSKLRIILCTKTQKYIKKGCQTFLAQVTKKEIEDKSADKRFEDVPIVWDFPKVFPEDLPRLPPTQKVEFQIDLVPGAVSVARALYRLAPSELQELSTQLQELSDKGLIRPSSSP